MSTRSIIGTVDPATGEFDGRYVHSDGYPTHQGPALAAIIARDGVTTALRKLTRDHGDWSIVSDDYVRDSDREAFIQVPGYGLAYTDEPDRLGGIISGDTVAGLEDTWLEWGYLFTGTGDNAGLWVIDAVLGTVTARIPLVDLTDTTGVDWETIECGPVFERCSHYAWAHDSNAPRRLSMRQWLGYDPLTPAEATAVVTRDGRRYTLTGSGGGAASGYFYAYARAENGHEERIAIYRVNTGAELDWLRYEYPAIRAA